MSKAKTATDETTETGKETKTAPGSSIEAQAKFLILNLANEARGIGTDGIEMVEMTFGADTVARLQELAGIIGSKGMRNMPLATQLEKAQTARNAIYERARNVEGPTFSFASEEDEAENDLLSMKIHRLKAAIAKEKEAATTEAAHEDFEAEND